MKVKVTRHYSITTISDVEPTDDVLKMDGRLALAIEHNTDILADIRKLPAVSDAFCLRSEPKLEIVFPTRESSAEGTDAHPKRKSAASLLMKG